MKLQKQRKRRRRKVYSKHSYKGAGRWARPRIMRRRREESKKGERSESAEIDGRRASGNARDADSRQTPTIVVYNGPFIKISNVKSPPTHLPPSSRPPFYCLPPSRPLFPPARPPCPGLLSAPRSLALALHLGNQQREWFARKNKLLKTRCVQKGGWCWARGLC